jgi:hypothetical protein
MTTGLNDLDFRAFAGPSVAAHLEDFDTVDMLVASV